MLRWSVEVDEEILSRAEQDVRRALILQNARFAQRFDAFSRLRTPRTEEWLRRIAIGACGIGLVLSLVLLVGSSIETGQVRGLHALLLVLFLVLTPVFLLAPRLRQAGVERIDRMLAGRAKKAISSWPAGIAREYAIDDGTIRSRVGGRDRFNRALSGVRYGLVGDATVILYARPNQQNPVVAMLVPSAERNAVSEALQSADVALETLSRQLLPPQTVHRTW